MLTSASLNTAARRCLRPLVTNRVYRAELTATRADAIEDARGLLVTDGDSVFAVRNVVQSGFYGRPVAIVQQIVLAGNYPKLTPVIRAMDAGRLMLWQEAMDVPNAVVEYVYSRLDEQDAFMLLLAGK